MTTSSRFLAFSGSITQALGKLSGKTWHVAPLTDAELFEMTHVMTVDEPNIVALSIEVFQALVEEFERIDPSFNMSSHWTRWVPMSEESAVFVWGAITDLRDFCIVILQARMGATSGTVMTMLESRGES